MNHILKESLTILSGVIIVFFILFAGIFLYFHLQNESRMSFQKYEFTKLQPGVHVTTIELFEYDQPPRPSYRNLTFKTNNESWAIGQAKSNSEDYSKTTSAIICRGKSTNSRCDHEKSPKGQEYIIETSYSQADQSTPFRQTISWLKNDQTRFWINLKDEEAAKYSAYSWGEIIDSTIPSDFTDVEVTKEKMIGV